MAAQPPSLVAQFGPGASAHNAVTANGKWTNGAAVAAGVYLSFDVTLLPKVVMVFNLSNTDDGWRSITMPDPSHVLWADALYHAGGIFIDWRAWPDIAELIIKGGSVVTVANQTSDAYQFTGFDLINADVIVGGDNETLLYFCLGSATPTNLGVVTAGYQFYDGPW